MRMLCIFAITICTLAVAGCNLFSQAIDPSNALGKGLDPTKVRTPVPSIQTLGGRASNPGELAIRFKSGIGQSGPEQVAYGFGLRLDKLETARIAATLPEPAKQEFEDREKILKVPIGTEEFWAKALGEYPSIEAVSFVPFRAPALGSFTLRDLNIHPIFSSDSASVQGYQNKQESIHELILGDLRRKFESKKADFRVLDSGDYILKIQVTNLQGEVLANQSFWEEFDPLTVVFFVAEGKLHIFITLNIKYAAVAGQHSPAGTAFRSLDPQYYHDTENYVSALTTDLLTSLRSKGIPK